MSSTFRNIPKPLIIAIRVTFISSTILCCISSTFAQNTEIIQQDGQQDVALLPVMSLTAENELVKESNQSYTVSQSSTATKLDLSLRDTPQTVQVYTREYLDDRHITSFQNLLRNITGVSTIQTDERQSVYARGFKVDYYLVDGLPSSLTLGAGDPDLSIYDRVEVVKGANGLIAGAGSPAMGLNLIRKRAYAKALTGKIETSVGSWDQFSSSADISAPLNADGTLRGRVFVKHTDEKSFMDFYHSDRNIVYGAIDYDMSDQTYLSFAASYQDLNRNGVRWGGLPAFYIDGRRTDFSRSDTVSSDWTFWNVVSTAFFANLKQNLWNDINLNVNYQYRRDDTDSLLYYTSGQVNPSSNTIPIENASVYRDQKRTDENNIDAYISIPFQMLSLDQEVIVGGSWNKTELKKNPYGQSYVAGNSAQTKQNLIDLLGQDVVDFNHMNTQLLKNLQMDKVNSLNETTQTAAYISGKFHLFEPLKIVAGARLSNWKYRAENGVGDRTFKHQLSPYLGITYDLSQYYSWYASYTSIFSPQNRKQQNGQYLDPIEGKSYETGIKAAFFDQRLNASVGLFRIEQDNVAQELLDKNGTQIKVDGTAENAYYGTQGVVSKGIEFTMSGELNANWQLNLGVAHFSAKDGNNSDVNPTNSRTTADLFMKYQQQNWFVGMGLNYFSKIYTGTAANRIDRANLYLANAMMGYKFTENITTQLNINNIFDKKYYEGIGSNAMVWGAPRNFTMSLSYSF
ncbi:MULTISPECIES: TonB-dependent siderophore receptor [unclassified Acinetobacter]|uniref:TonB-dependent siderophore receptor n=1 Tax=unclassified Acinetobacter TaxID=196816 RepID=UPI002934A650|nr:MULTISPECIES: TonB-dependent siderophore receptor [unclassified Acinetobacter]WOE32463.1 TonB-dependent siderophore receptor [Acinetobacter sp. SAAs470]WOE37938.1 TonB-dependent siderophore receptor [Acinetobacter sp. SAAs474]